MHVGFSVPYDQQENFECSLKTFALGRTCLIGSVFTAFFFKDAASEILCNLEQQRRGWQTLTFHMATQYALTHPLETVLVIDLCQQANVS